MSVMVFVHVHEAVLYGITKDVVPSLNSDCCGFCNQGLSVYRVSLYRDTPCIECCYIERLLV